MKKTAVVYPTKFEILAQKTISQAFAICEEKVKANEYSITPELKTLSAIAVSLEKAVAAFVVAERLSK